MGRFAKFLDQLGGVVVHVSVGFDHAGYRLANQLSEYLMGLGHDTILCGPKAEQPAVNYAPFCIQAAEEVANGRSEFGIVIGGSAQGEQIAANKVFGIRAALCFDTHMARLARRDNNANVLAIAGRMVAVEYAKEILDVWMSTNFEGGRHEVRLRDISDYEEQHKLTPQRKEAQQR